MPTAPRGRGPSPKSYDQYCPVARALDVLGERWTLLIVRDLVIGPKRYTDLRDGLPGIASDLLTARLRTLESAGFVRRRQLPRPAPAVVYELTDAGRALEPIIMGLAQAGLALLGPPRPADDVRAERLLLSLPFIFRRDRYPELTETYQLHIDDEGFVVTVAHGEAAIARGTAISPAMTLTTDARSLVAVRRGEISPAAALADGTVRLDGDPAALERFLDAFAHPAADRGDDGRR